MMCVLKGITCGWSLFLLQHKYIYFAGSMAIPLQLQHIERTGYSVDLYVPDAIKVQQAYLQQKQQQPDTPFPYWAKIWPAALAMADHIHQHPQLVQNKTVLELAAGLALPGLVAARYAKSVCCSDYLEEAVAAMNRSAKHAALQNMTCRLLNWHHLPDDIHADVLMMSDVNYDTEEFDQLYKVLLQFLQRDTAILLATPQRLMAKPFIEKLLLYCTEQSEVMIHQQEHTTAVSLLLLKNTAPQ